MKRFIILLFIVAHTLAGGSLNKVYYHQGRTMDQLVFYCTQALSVSASEKKVKRDNTVLVQKIYDIVGCLTAADIEIVKQLLENNSLYKGSIKEIGSNKVRITFIYDPKITHIALHRFTSIQNKPGLVFVVRQRSSLVPAVGGKKNIIIDAGHGGHDTGALGVAARSEKEIALEVALKVAAILKQRGYNVKMTRTRDTFVPLDKRTTLSNRNNADLFVSLHVNSAPNAQSSGIETYSCSHQLFTPEIPGSVSRDMESAKLAQDIQSNVLKNVSKNKGVKDRKCKKSVSQVLMGTQMPSALVELGFCSNKKEAERLVSSEYQNELAHGVCDGISHYLMRM